MPDRTLALLVAALLTGAVASNSAQAEEPTTAQGFCERGHHHELRNRYAEALADYSRAVELDPRYVEAYFSRSSLYASRPALDERAYEKAIADLTTILLLSPQDFSARFNRALAYESLEQFDEAIADYTEIIEGDTDFSRYGDGRDNGLAHAHHYRGRAYQESKQDLAKAVADYDEALRLAPDIEMVHYRRGRALSELKEYARAVTDFTVALERDPDYPNLQCAYAWQLATAADPEFRDAKQALQLAQKANETLEWSVQDHLETLAAACAASGEFDEAVKWQKKALELFFKAEARPELFEVMQERLRKYEAGEPYRVE